MDNKFSKYSYEFIRHISLFSKDYQLELDTRPSVIALSGGLDSVALLSVLMSLYELGKLKFRPRAIMIDHGTREEIKAEIASMRNYCLNLGVDLKVIKINISLNSNFEHLAREARYKALYEHTSHQELLVLGHHLNDSLEWSFLQSLKSSKLSSCLGIPLVNGRIRRPFLCVSKKHIERFAKEMNLKWFEDSSNSNLKYERNRVRSHLNELEKFHPKMLANYVTRSHEMAKLLGLQWPKHFTEDSQVLKRSWGHIIKHNGNQLDLEKVRVCVEDASSTSRGKLRSQLENLIKMRKSGKFGPLNLSGGVKAYQFHNFTLVCKSGMEISLIDNVSQITEPVAFLVKVPSKSALKKLPFVKGPLEGLGVNYFYRFPSNKVVYWL